MTGPNLPIPVPSRQLLPELLPSSSRVPSVLASPFVQIPAQQSQSSLSPFQSLLAGPCLTSTPSSIVYSGCPRSPPKARSYFTLSRPLSPPAFPVPLPGSGQSFTLSLSLQPLSQAAPCTVPLRSPPTCRAAAWASARSAQARAAAAAATAATRAPSSARVRARLRGGAGCAAGSGLCERCAVGRARPMAAAPGLPAAAGTGERAARTARGGAGREGVSWAHYAGRALPRGRGRPRGRARRLFSRPTGPMSLPHLSLKKRKKKKKKGKNNYFRHSFHSVAQPSLELAALFKLAVNLQWSPCLCLPSLQYDHPHPCTNTWSSLPSFLPSI